MMSNNRSTSRGFALISLLWLALVALPSHATLVAKPANITLQLEPGTQSQTQKILLTGNPDTVYAALTLSAAPAGFRYELEGCPNTEKFASLTEGCVLRVTYKPANTADINDTLTLSYQAATTDAGRDTRAERLLVQVTAKYTRPDSDGDGVDDQRDQCPMTPDASQVDEQGCADSQRDDDEDGVSNALDQCPALPGLDDEGCASEAQISSALLAAAGGDIQLQNTATALASTCYRVDGGQLASDCDALVNAAILGLGGVTDALDAITPDGALLANAAVQRTHSAHSRHIGNRLAALRTNPLMASRALTLNVSDLHWDPSALIFSLAPLDTSAYVSPTDAPDAASGAIGSSEESQLLANSQWGAFISADLTRNSRNANGLGAAFKADSHIVTAGVDYRLTPTTILGAAISQVQNRSTLTGTTGFFDRDETTLTAFGSYSGNNWYTDVTLAWGDSRMKQARSVAYALGNGTTVAQQMQARYGGTTASGSVVLGWQGSAIGASNADTPWESSVWMLNISSALDYIYSQADAFAEQASNPTAPGAGWAVAVEEQSQEWLTGRITATASRVVNTAWGVLVPYAEIDAVQEFANRPHSVATQFVADPEGAPLMVLSEKPDHSYFRARIGASVQLAHGISGFIDYGRLMGVDRWREYTVSGGLRVEF